MHINRLAVFIQAITFWRLPKGLMRMRRAGCEYLGKRSLLIPPLFDLDCHKLNLLILIVVFSI